MTSTAHLPILMALPLGSSNEGVSELPSAGDAAGAPLEITHRLQAPARRALCLAGDSGT